MSEKRFKKGYNFSCVDTETGKSYWYACNLCGLLNRQQSIITKQERRIRVLENLLTNMGVKWVVDDE